MLNVAHELRTDGGDIVNAIRWIRKSRGYTIRGLSMKSGVHYVSICRYETGKAEPSVRNLTRLADALGCKVDDLLAHRNDTTTERTA